MCTEINAHPGVELWEIILTGCKVGERISVSLKKEVVQQNGKLQ
jgi:hypothetical protein